MTEASASVLRDAYVGAPGRGHVLHYVAGLGGALGADATVRPRPPRDDDADLAGRNVWITLAMLGLYQPAPHLTTRRWPSVGEYPASWSIADFQTGPPIEPLDRALPADAYWAAKRIAALPETLLAAALDAGAYHDDAARSHLAERLHNRQLLAVRWGFAQVTPCEVEGVALASPRSPAAVVLRDEAIRQGAAEAPSTGYRVEIVDETGRPVAEPQWLGVSGGALFAVWLPEGAPAYVVMRVRASRSGRAAPRAMEVHVVHAGAVWRVVGVVH